MNAWSLVASQAQLEPLMALLYRKPAKPQEASAALDVFCFFHPMTVRDKPVI